MSNFKKPKIRSIPHLEFIRSLPCLKCGVYPSDAAHIRRGTDGGTGIKPSDEWTVPLCRECHQEQHRIGEPAFFRNMDKVRELARKLWLYSGDSWSSITIICKERTGLFHG